MTITDTPTDTPVMSALVGAFEAAWAEIMSNHPEIPEVVVVVAPAERRGSSTGHFSAGAWRRRSDGTTSHEVVIVADHLNRDPADVMLTLLHEAAHALAAVRGIKDTSRGGRYHNRRFVALAAELGLDAPEAAHPVFGHHAVRLTEDAGSLYSSAIGALGEAIDAYRAANPEGDEDGGDGGSTTARKMAVCECWPPRRLPISARALAQAPVLCGACASPFEIECESDDA